MEVTSAHTSSSSSEDGRATRPVLSPTSTSDLNGTLPLMFLAETTWARERRLESTITSVEHCLNRAVRRDLSPLTSTGLCSAVAFSFLDETIEEREQRQERPLAARERLLNDNVCGSVPCIGEGEASLMGTPTAESISAGAATVHNRSRRLPMSANLVEGKTIRPGEAINVSNQQFRAGPLSNLYQLSLSDGMTTAQDQHPATKSTSVDDLISAIPVLNHVNPAPAVLQGVGAQFPATMDERA